MFEVHGEKTTEPILKTDSFTVAMRWLIAKANEYDPDRVYWYENQSNSIIMVGCNGNHFCICKVS